MRRLILLLVVVSAGCFSPDYKNASWSCGPGGECPSGLACGTDGLCHSGGASPADAGGLTADARRFAPDAGVAADATAFPDAPPGDHLLTVLLVGDDGTNSNATITDGAGDTIGVCAAASCAYAIPAGTSVTVGESVFGPAITFDEFAGACVGETCNFTMTSDETVYVQFDAVYETLEVDSAGAGAIQVEPVGDNCTSDCSYDLPYGTTVTLTVTPASGTQVDSVVGPCAVLPCTFALEGNETEDVSYVGGGVIDQVQFTATGSQVYGEGIAIDPSSGYVWVAGDFQGSIDFGDGNGAHASQGASDIFLAVLAGDEIVSATTMGGPGDDRVEAFVWNDSAQQMDLIASTTSGGTFAGGTIASPFAGLPGTILVAMNTDGSAAAVAPIFQGAIYSATVDGDGQIVLGGWYQESVTWGSSTLPTAGDGGIEGIVGIVSATGALGADFPIAAQGDDWVSQVTMDSNTILLAGIVGGNEPFLDFTTSDGDGDAFYALIDEDGNVYDEAVINSAGFDNGTGAVRDVGSGHILLEGYVSNPTMIAGTSLTPTSTSEGFLADFANGEPVYALDLGPAGVTYGLTFTNFSEVSTGNFLNYAAALKTFEFNDTSDQMVWDLAESPAGQRNLFFPQTVPDGDDMGGVWAVGWTQGPQQFQDVTLTPPSGGVSIPVLHIGP